jgi:type I restriction-modification system DNA methylase subunit
MGLFQQTVVNKYGAAQSAQIKAAYALYVSYFHDPARQDNIRASKEKQFQEGFLRELFVRVFGYTLFPDPNHDLITEKKNETDAKKADGAIIIDGEVRAVIELKDTKTTDLKQVEAQAFSYKNNNRNASYVVISNFEKLRFYIDNTIDYIEFNLFTLTADEFAQLWLCLVKQNIATHLPRTLKAESVSREDHITKQLYADYSAFKRDLFADLTAHNPMIDRLTLFKKTQKLLDRLLFVFFAEDRSLLPPNSMARIIDKWQKLKDMDEYRPLYDQVKKYFEYMNTGYKGKDNEVFAYNGGLFKSDDVLDAVVITDDVLRQPLLKLSDYNFASEVDVNILGHIFENSLTEIEEITKRITESAGIVGGSTDVSGVTAIMCRKKDGIFYTPRYVTAYIVEHTLGKLCADKKAEMNIVEADYFADRKRQKATTKKLAEKLEAYRAWLLALTICDPACGSGAFLNAALDFLINEHTLVDQMTAKLYGDALVFPVLKMIQPNRPGRFR